MKILLSLFFTALILVVTVSAQRSDRSTAEFLTPIWKLVGSERQPEEGLGASAAADGNTMVVGVPSDLYGPTNWVQGSAYVFVRNGDTWSEQGHLVSPVGAQLDFMGYEVAISGDTVIADCTYCDPSGLTNAGSPYVFVRNGSTWSVQQQIISPDAAANEHYGNDVTIDGDTLAVSCGACTRDGKKGLVDIFTRSGSTWTRTQRIQAPTQESTTAFGGAISLKGNYLAIQRSGVVQGNGVVMIFEKVAGTWIYVQTVSSPEAVASDRFGEEVDVDGDSLAVYANAYSGGGPIGSVYIFTRGSSVWTHQGTLRASDGQTNSQFGAGLDLVGDRILIGAYGQKVGNNTYQGQGYLFTRTGTVWAEVQKMNVPTGVAFDYLGKAVALSGDAMYLGLTGDRDNSQFFDNYGAVFVFKISASTVSVNGRVLFANGRGAFPSRVTLTDSSGLVRTANTNSFGYYRFLDLQPDRSYTIKVAGKKTNYQTRTVTPTANVADVDFVPIPN